MLCLPTVPSTEPISTWELKEGVSNGAPTTSEPFRERSVKTRLELDPGSQNSLGLVGNQI